MKQAITAISILGIALGASAAHADKKQYTLADLKALVGSKSYQEAVEHLGDISPSERTADWLTVATDAASGYISGLSNDHLVVKVLAIEEIDGKYPQVLKSPKYTKARGEIGLKAYEACFKVDYEMNECVQHAMKFIEGDPGNADLALKMSKLVRMNGNAYGALPFFKKALSGKATAAVCKDEDLKLAVVAGVGLPPDYDNAKIAKDIASGTCWEQLKKPIVDAVSADASGYTHDNGCALLKAKGATAKGCK
jgi:hypothetical protein